jgi:hypothetical protein
MEEEIFSIINECFKKQLIYGKPTTIKTASEKAVKEFKDFITWVHNPKCDFSISYNGIDKSRDKINYERNGKTYNIDQVFNYWQNHK